MTDPKDYHDENGKIDWCLFAAVKGTAVAVVGASQVVAGPILGPALLIGGMLAAALGDDDNDDEGRSK